MMDDSKYQAVWAFDDLSTLEKADLMQLWDRTELARHRRLRPDAVAKRFVELQRLVDPSLCSDVLQYLVEVADRCPSPRDVKHVGHEIQSLILGQRLQLVAKVGATYPRGASIEKTPGLQTGYGPDPYTPCRVS